jgi:DNA replication protein DnaC
MLNQPLMDKLTQLRLPGIKEGLKEQMANTKYSDLSFEERLGLLIDYELTLRSDRRLKRRLKQARFREKACITDLDMSLKRGIERKLILSLTQCDWIREHLNVIITGATGVGKTYLACALGRSACEHGFSTRYFKTSRLLHEIECCHADGSWGKFLDQLARTQLLILDDWFRDPLNTKQTRNLLEVFDDRWQIASLILISQIPVENWHSQMQDPTLADAILDRIIHNSYQIEMKGESQRKLKSKNYKNKNE